MAGLKSLSSAPEPPAGDGGESTAMMFSIGMLSRRTGVSPSTLREWENYNIIRPTRSGTHRRYGEDEVRRVRQAVDLRRKNFSLAAIAALLGEADEPDADASETARARVGKRLRDARRAKGLHLTEVSRLAGVSASHLSTIERSTTLPSLALLQRLAMCYKIDVADLFGGEHDLSAPRVAFWEEHKALTSDMARVRVQPVARGEVICSDMYEADPGGGSGGAYSHIGEECVYIIEGTAEFQFGDTDRRLLHAGQSIAFDSSIPHRWTNSGDGVLRMFWSNARTSSTTDLDFHGDS